MEPQLTPLRVHCAPPRRPRTMTGQGVFDVSLINMLYLSIYIYIYVICLSLSLYIYIYIHTHVCIYNVYIYIYIYVYIHILMRGLFHTKGSQTSNLAKDSTDPECVADHEWWIVL